LFSEKPHRYITAKVPTSDTGTARWNQRGAEVAEEQVHHQDHQRHGDQQGVLGLLQVALITGERSMATSSLTLAGSSACRPAAGP
jgi:hypothetical protein